ncbi:xanthine dehydrogenase family protein molybdopterin-binding subunit [Ancylobacter rudongensis]|uniref:CO or xanthine dehydrogenase, Mo-binding subunit n=1 Tax=Ancylobacter rudongensis TaxID=177413 RepID=A0A1G4SDY0_9HYPH|nr:molybdopterin cofactor-binding domain-containing protein [Ancylobacter rudongensis]SCW67268.1 CO or xanthine dehydrogenase, Mo-binding subunit [Ancylobacter rudongensis]
MTIATSRRAFLLGSGALVVSFSLGAEAQEGEVQAGTSAPQPTFTAIDNDRLDSWIRVDANSHITVFTGKAELGQGIRTALTQVAAEELEVAPGEIELITADTGRTPNEGFTAGSMSMPNSGTSIRKAAAQMRRLLVEAAAQTLAVAPESLTLQGKQIRSGDRALSYGEVAAALNLEVPLAGDPALKAPDTLTVIGRDVPRLDIPGKVTGAPAYIQDMRLPGMLHARVVRPPGYGATLTQVDTSAIEALPGVVGVVREGNFLAVIAEREFQAVTAMRELARRARWSAGTELPEQAEIHNVLRGLESEVGTVAEEGDANPSGDKVFEARFTRPYQMHGSIGPSCGIARLEPDGTLIVWSHTQGVYPDRAAIAEMLGMEPGRVRVIHVEGSGCYGHNGADDAAADAALIASRLPPGRPVRVQWMREQENAWEPFGPAMSITVRGAVTNGRISDFTFDLWSNIHTTRPGGAGALLAARQKSGPATPNTPRLQISPSGNGDRNANPLYTIPNKRILWHFIPDMPLRVSAMRALGAYANVFALESAIDELALLAQADPVAFRLAHLEDERARAVVQMAAERFGWETATRGPGRGKGFAFARYKNLAAYLAVAVEVEVERETGRTRLVRAVAAIDSGQAVSPNGIRNQTEGGILQAASWTLYEAVTFDRREITSVDWSSYPILRFASVPETVEVHVIDRPGEPFLGTGEAAQGPVAGAIGNAVRDAIGLRLTDLPFSRQRVLAALTAG